MLDDSQTYQFSRKSLSGSASFAKVLAIFLLGLSVPLVWMAFAIGSAADPIFIDQRQWFLPLGVRQICRLTVAECH